MAKGIVARISVLEKTVERLGASLGKVIATLSGGKEATPKKACKPRQPRQALGTASAGKTARADSDFNAGAPGPDDPRYLDAPVNQKRRGRKKAEPAAAKKEAEAGAPPAGEEGA